MYLVAFHSTVPRAIVQPWLRNDTLAYCKMYALERTSAARHQRRARVAAVARLSSSGTACLASRCAEWRSMKGLLRKHFRKRSKVPLDSSENEPKVSTTGEIHQDSSRAVSLKFYSRWHTRRVNHTHRSSIVKLHLSRLRDNWTFRLREMSLRFVTQPGPEYRGPRCAKVKSPYSRCIP